MPASDRPNDDGTRGLAASPVLTGAGAGDETASDTPPGSAAPDPAPDARLFVTAPADGINPPVAAGFLDVGLDSSGLKRRALAGAGVTLAVQVLKFVLKFGSALVLGRLLGPADFGLVAMVNPILGFVSTLNDLGFAQAIVQRRDITPRQVTGLFWINTLLSAVLAAVVIAIAPLVGLLYHEPRTVPITAVLGALIVVGTLGLVPNALLARRLRFSTQAAIDLGTVALGVLVTVVTALRGDGYWSLVIGQAAATIAGTVAAWLAVGWMPGRPRRRGDGVRSLVSFGVNLTGVNIATYFSMTADTMIVGVFGGKVQLGLYNRSYTLVTQPLGQLMAPVARVALPLLSRLDDPAQYRNAFDNMLRLTMLLTAPMAITCFIIPGPVIAVLLGPKWTAAAGIFGWICFGGLLAPVFNAVGWLFTSQARTDEQMRWSIVTALLSIAAFAIGIPWGALGVAISSGISFTALQLPLMINRATRTGPVGPADVGRALAGLAVATIVTAGAVFAVRALHPPGLVFVAGAVAYAVYTAGSLALPGGRGFVAGLRQLRRGRRA